MSVPEVVEEVGLAENEAKVKEFLQKFLRGGKIQRHASKGEGEEITPEVMLEAIHVFSHHIADMVGLSYDDVSDLREYLEKEKTSQ